MASTAGYYRVYHEKKNAYDMQGQNEAGNLPFSCGRWQKPTSLLNIYDDPSLVIGQKMR